VAGRLQVVDIRNTAVWFYIIAGKTMILFNIMAFLNTELLFIATSRFVVKNNTRLPA
jgi:hypothetical protein